jgi:hypothetical protein
MAGLKRQKERVQFYHLSRQEGLKQYRRHYWKTKKYGVFERRQQQIHVPEIVMQI